MVYVIDYFEVYSILIYEKKYVNNTVLVEKTKKPTDDPPSKVNSAI